jgi:competence protein ComFC
MNMQNILDSFVNVIAPAACGSCGENAAFYPLPICRSCRDSLITGRIEPCTSSGNLERTYSLLPYRSAIKCCLRDLKYGANRRTLELISELVSAFPGSVKIAEEKPDIIIPVPLHPSRLHTRGYNQSELISRVLCRYLSVPVNPRILIKIRNTRPQTGLERARRTANLKGSFRVVDRPALIGKTVLLVDDIMTTGTTLDECADELLHSGARSITGFTVAKTM